MPDEDQCNIKNSSCIEIFDWSASVPFSLKNYSLFMNDDKASKFVNNNKAKE